MCLGGTNESFSHRLSHWVTVKVMRWIKENILYDVQEEMEIPVPEVVQPPEIPQVEIPAPILEEVTV